MRPTKLTRKFLEVAEEVVFYDINAIILTDEELVMTINEKLEDKEQISDRTFQRWKSKNKDEQDSNKDKELDEVGKEFCRLIKKALKIQKQGLFNKFREEPNQWQKWAWIIERKFDDWNIKHKSEMDFNKPLPIISLTNVQGSNSNQEDQKPE